jgi:hypothetical protein
MKQASQVLFWLGTVPFPTNGGRRPESRTKSPGAPAVRESKP